VIEHRCVVSQEDVAMNRNVHGPAGSVTGASPGLAPPLERAKPGGRASVVVTVTDVLGMPQAGAAVWINTVWSDEDKQALTDAAGRAAFEGVIADKATVQAWTDESRLRLLLEPSPRC
jgi:hypothetical protein